MKTRMRKSVFLVIVLLIVAAGSANAQFFTECFRMPLPPPTGATVTVSTVDELVAAVQQANADGDLTILVADGYYTLSEMLWISGDNVTVRSVSGNRDAVVIRGQGMFGSVTHIFNVVGKHFTAADMTIGWVANHAIQIHGENDADNALIHNVRFVDTREQMLKVSFEPGNPTSADQGIVEWCRFEYRAGIGPQYYIGGVVVHQAHDWIVRHNEFVGIRSPEFRLAEHAIHFRSESSNTLVEKNVITNCDRGIGFGMEERGHSGGIIRNNMVHTTRDVGIILENSSATEVSHNTVYTEGGYDNSIEYRYSRTANGVIVNNLTNAAISSRDGGTATVTHNVTTAEASWFENPGDGDLHLVGSEPTVVDQARPQAEVVDDIDCQTRPQGLAPDIGADEIPVLTPAPTATPGAAPPQPGIPEPATLLLLGLGLFGILALLGHRSKRK